MKRIQLPDAEPPPFAVRGEPMKGGKPAWSDPTAERAVRNADRSPDVTWQLALRRAKEKGAQQDERATHNGELRPERLDRLQERYRSHRL